MMESKDDLSFEGGVKTHQHTEDKQLSKDREQPFSLPGKDMLFKGSTTTVVETAQLNNQTVDEWDDAEVVFNIKKSEVGDSEVENNTMKVKEVDLTGHAHGDTDTAKPSGNHSEPQSRLLDASTETCKPVYEHKIGEVTVETNEESPVNTSAKKAADELEAESEHEADKPDARTEKEADKLNAGTEDAADELEAGTEDVADELDAKIGENLADELAAGTKDEVDKLDVGSEGVADEMDAGIENEANKVDAATEDMADEPAAGVKDVKMEAWPEKPDELRLCNQKKPDDMNQCIQRKVCLEQLQEVGPVPEQMNNDNLEAGDDMQETNVKQRLEETMSAVKHYQQVLEALKKWFEGQMVELIQSTGQLGLTEQLLQGSSCSDLLTVNSGILLAYVYAQTAKELKALLPTEFSPSAAQGKRIQDIKNSEFLQEQLEFFDENDVFDSLRSALFFVASNYLYACDSTVEEREDAFHSLPEDTMRRYNNDAEMMACLYLSDEQETGKASDKDSDFKEDVSESEAGHGSNSPIQGVVDWLWGWGAHPWLAPLIKFTKDSCELFFLLVQILWYSLTGNLLWADYGRIQQSNKHTAPVLTRIALMLNSHDSICSRYHIRGSGRLITCTDKHPSPFRLIDRIVGTTFDAVMQEISFYQFIAGDHLKVLNTIKGRANLPTDIVEHYHQAYADLDKLRHDLHRRLLDTANKACRDVIGSFRKDCSCGSLLHIRLAPS